VVPHALNLRNVLRTLIVVHVTMEYVREDLVVTIALTIVVVVLPPVLSVSLENVLKEVLVMLNVL